MLGAAALGDIGRHFPDTDPRYKDVDSMSLLATTTRLIADAGYRVVNVDSNIIAQRPKLSPYLNAMSERIAGVLGVSARDVSVKAKTNESVGPEGRGEAISAQAVAMLKHERRDA
jgi:2-C-methyl-D-erythritol 2,4-cyclodiphosphate synthase